MYTEKEVVDWALSEGLSEKEFEELLTGLKGEVTWSDEAEPAVIQPPPVPQVEVPEELSYFDKKVDEIKSILGGLSRDKPPVEEAAPTLDATIDTSQGPVGTNLTGREEFPSDQGTTSTELSRTFQGPDGLWHNYPSIHGGVQLQNDDEVRDKWLADGKKDPETGVDYSKGYATVEEAEAAAQGRSDTIQPSNLADTIQPSTLSDMFAKEETPAFGFLGQMDTGSITPTGRPQDAPDTGVGFFDRTTANIGIGANKFWGGLGGIIESKWGEQTLGRGMQKYARERILELRKTFPPELLEEMDTPLFVPDPEGEGPFHWTGYKLNPDLENKLSATYGKAISQLPHMAATIGTGAGLTKTVYPALTKIVDKLPLSVVKKLFKPLTGYKWAYPFTQLAKKEIKDKAIGGGAGAIGFGISEGLMSGGFSRTEVGHAIRHAPKEMLEQSPLYQKLLEENGYRHDVATEMFSDELSARAMRDVTITTAMLGAPLGIYFGKLLLYSPDSLVKRLISGGLGEMGQEIPQDFMESIITEVAKGDAGMPVREIDKIIAQALEAGVISIAPGSGAAVIMGSGKPMDDKIDALKKHYERTFLETELEGRGTGSRGFYRGPATMTVDDGVTGPKEIEIEEVPPPVEEEKPPVEESEEARQLRIETQKKIDKKEEELRQKRIDEEEAEREKSRIREKEDEQRRIETIKKKEEEEKQERERKKQEEEEEEKRRSDPKLVREDVKEAIPTDKPMTPESKRKIEGILRKATDEARKEGEQELEKGTIKRVEVIKSKTSDKKKRLDELKRLRAQKKTEEPLGEPAATKTIYEKIDEAQSDENLSDKEKRQLAIAKKRLEKQKANLESWKEVLGESAPKIVEETLGEPKAETDEDAEIAALEAEIRKEDYDEIVEDYENTPTSVMRTGEQMRDQAYSTPAPIAFLARELGRTEDADSVFEPTAGHGSLVAGIDPKKVSANEINPDRIKSLKEAGFKVTDKNAQEELVVPEKSQDTVLMNPPFGKLDPPVKVEGYTISKRDHLIAVKNLMAMKDSGRAVLIVSASREKDTRFTKAQRGFFNYLYSHYNVADHFEISGSLYEKLGASSPISMIVIAGRKKSQTFAAENSPERIINYDDLYRRFTEAHGSSERVHTTTGKRPDVSKASGKDVESPEGPSGVSGTSGTGATGTGETGKVGTGETEGSDKRDGEPTDDDRKEPGETDGRTDDERRPTGEGSETGVPPTESDPTGKATGEGVSGEGKKPDGDVRPPPVAKVDPEDLLTPYEQVQVEGSSRSVSKNVPPPLVPSNMVAGIKKSLEKLIAKVGPLDEFVTKELGYKTEEELFNAFFGAQIDGIAMAIDQLREGKALVIADQTGLGKGRQAAAIIEWAKRQGKVPVFVTARSALFTAMYHDIRDIGKDVKPFILNNDTEGSILGKDKKVIHGPVSPKVFKGKRDAIASGRLPLGNDAVFTTYSQFQSEFVGGKANPKRKAMLGLAPNAIFILDEIHKAAGQSNTNEYFMELLGKSRENGTLYLSATFAKKAVNLPILFTTNLSKATDGNLDALIQGATEGGLPYQRLVAAALAEDGQLVNRKNTFKGIDVRIESPDLSTEEGKKEEARETKLSDLVTEQIRNINVFSKLIVKDIRKKEAEMLRLEGATITGADGKTRKAFDLSNINFSSIFHNIVSQFLLSTKVETLSKHIIAAHAKGQKTISTLQNTMGAFLTKFVEDRQLKEGDTLEDFNWNQLLLENLKKTMILTKTPGNGDPSVKIEMTVDELDTMNRMYYEMLVEDIGRLELGGLPVSPIDMLKQNLEKENIKTGEITRRGWAVDYRGDTPILTKREDDEKNSALLVQQYQDGDIDSLVINQAGAEGVSLHSKEGIKDLRVRHTYVWQPSPDINVMIQLMGRANRVGQVNKPKITILSSTLPSEKRPTAVLAGKLEKLNANTSANSKSALTFDATNIFNSVGDRMIAEWLEANDEIADQAGITNREPFGEEGSLAIQVTGKFAIMPVAMQDSFWNDIGEAYHNEIAQLDEMGLNPLDTAFHDFRAVLESMKLIEKFKKEDMTTRLHRRVGQRISIERAKPKAKTITLIEETDKTSAFGSAAELGLYSVRKELTILKPKEVQEQVFEALGMTHDEYIKGVKDDTEAKEEWLNNVITKIDKRLDTIKQRLKEEKNKVIEAEKKDNAKYPAQKMEIDDKYRTAVLQSDKLKREVNRFVPGSAWKMFLDGEEMTGIVTQVRTPGLDKEGKSNPFVLSQNSVKFVRNKGYPAIVLSLSKIKEIDEQERAVDTIPVISYPDGRSLEEIFARDKEEEEGVETREHRYIITGNLIAGLRGTTSKGKIIDYSDSEGDRSQGILLPKNFNPATDLRQEKKFTRGREVYDFLKEGRGGYRMVGFLNPREGIDTDILMITKREFGDDLRIQVKTGKAGAKFHQDQELIAVTGDFVGKRARTVLVTVPPERAEKAIDIILEKHGPLYGVIASMSKEHKKIMGDPESVLGDPSEIVTTGSITYTKTMGEPSRGTPKKGGRRWPADEHESRDRISGGLKYHYPPDHPRYEPERLRITLHNLLKSVFGESDARPDTIRHLIRKGLGVPINDDQRITNPSYAGVFYPQKGTVRLRNKNVFSTITHELGHSIRFTYPILKERLFTEHKAELLELTPDAYSSKSNDTQLEEGFAEYIRLYLTKREEAYKHAPDLSITFENFLTDHAILDAILEEITAMVHTWMGLSARDRIAAKVGEPSFLSKVKNTSLTGLPAIIYSATNKTISYWANSAWSIGMMAEKLKQQIKDGGGQEVLWEEDDAENLFTLMSGWQWQLDSAISIRAVPFKFEDRRDASKFGISLHDALKPVLELNDNEMLADFGYWMIVKRARELKQPTPTHPRGRENLFTDDEIDAMLDYFEDNYPVEIQEAFQKASDGLKRFQDFFIQYAIDGGALTPELGELFRSYIAYIPFFRVDEEQLAPEKHARDVGGRKGTPFKALIGGTSNIANVIDNVINNVSNIISYTNHNYVIIKTLEMAQRTSLGGILEKVEVPPSVFKISTKDILDSLITQMPKDNASQIERRRMLEKFIAPQMLEELKTMQLFFRPSGKEDLTKRIIIAKQKGKTIAIRIHREGVSHEDKQLGDMVFKALLSLRPTDVDGFNKALYYGQRIPRAGIVLSPFFQMANIARDTFSAFMNSVAKKTFIPIWDTAKGWGRVVVTKLMSNEQRREWLRKKMGTKKMKKMEDISRSWQLARDMGATYSSQWLGQHIGERRFKATDVPKLGRRDLSFKERMQAIWANRKRPYGTKLDPIQRMKEILTRPAILGIQSLEQFGDTMESPSRAEEADKVWKDNQPTPEQVRTLPENIIVKMLNNAAIRSAVAAKNVSLNFSQKGYGKWAIWMNRSVLFLNPRIQEMMMLFRKGGIKPSPTRFVQVSGMILFTTFKRWVTVAVPAMILGAYNDEEEWYKDLTAQQKDSYVYLTEHEKWPMPFAWGLISMRLPQLFMENIMLKVKQEEGLTPAQMKQFKKQLITTMLNMIGGIPIPALMEPSIELLMDKAIYHGYAIEGHWLSANRPKGHRFKSRTSQALVEFGYRNPDSPLSPLQLQHLVDSHLTGFGYLGLTLSDAFVGAVMDDIPTRPEIDQPFLRRFFHNPETRSFSRHTVGFRNKVKNSLIEGDTYLRFKMDQEHDRAQEYLEEHPMAQFGSFKKGSIGKLDKKISELLSAKAHVERLPDKYFSTGMTKKEIGTEKGRRVNYFNTQILRLSKVGNQALETMYNISVESIANSKIKVDLPDIRTGD